MPAPSGKPRRRDGCGFLLLTCFFTCLFLIVNGALVASFYTWLAPLGPPAFRQPRIAQALLFLGPVVLIFAEWWIVDFCVERFSRRE